MFLVLGSMSYGGGGQVWYGCRVLVVVVVVFVGGVGVRWCTWCRIL